MPSEIPTAHAVRYELLHTDASSSARCGVLSTPHGELPLPTFMPVGTVGTVKGLTIDQVAATGAGIILGNTYHLALRPGAEVVAQLGGLHAFSGWEGPILTDSGGFQIFSLADRVKITEQGATFQSHIDGASLSLTPEESIAIQEQLGSDIAMQLDHVIALPADRDAIADAMLRSVRWAGRCQQAAQRGDQSIFAIVQGGLDAKLRQESAERLVELDFAGYAIGGLSVGEEPAEMYQCLEHTVPHLPADRPRYLMGVGRPQDLIEAIYRGVDMFDCVMPTRNGRNALAFTDEGPLRLRNECHKTDSRPLDEHCFCPACQRSRGYLRHLFMAGEMLGPVLLSIHNLTYYQRLMVEAREAIAEDRFAAYRRQKLAGWAAGSQKSE